MRPEQLRELLTTEMPRLSQALFQVAYMLLGDRAAAEDIAQETLKRGLERRTEFQGDDVLPWLYRIGVNLCRAKRRLEWRRPVAVDPRHLDDRGAGAHGPATSAVLRETHQRVAAAIAGLRPILREAFVLHYVEHLSHASIASICGITPEAVNMRIARARRLLVREFPELVGLLPKTIRKRFDHADVGTPEDGGGEPQDHSGS